MASINFDGWCYVDPEGGLLSESFRADIAASWEAAWCILSQMDRIAWMKEVQNKGAHVVKVRLEVVE